MTEPVVTPTPTVPDAAVQAAADKAAAAAASQDGAVKTAEQIAAEAAAKPPAEQTYTLALPKDAVLDASAVEKVTTFAKAHTLSPAAAQTALDIANAEVAADRTRQEQVHASAFQKLATETWPSEIKADKEFGGANYDATVEAVKRAADQFFTPAEKQILNSTGWGNHPMLVRAFARIGRAMAEDKIVTGGAGGGGAKKTDAQVIYPNMNP